MANTIFTTDVTIDTFTEVVATLLREKLASAEITVSKVDKNNGLVLTGVTIRMDKNTAPTIYMERYLEEFIEGKELDKICDEILRVNENSQIDIDCSFYTRWDEVAPTLRMRLVNASKNEHLAAECPHFRYGDLLVLFVSFVRMDSGLGSILIRNGHLTAWEGITKETLLEQAKKNQADSFYIISMYDKLKEMMGDDAEGLFLPPDTEEFRNGMFVCSNNDNHYGAVAMLFADELIKPFAEKWGKSFWIIPSSIHEILLVPQKEFDNIEDVNEMICEVNERDVWEDELLNDHAYLFDLETGTLLCGNEPMVIQ